MVEWAKELAARPPVQLVSDYVSDYDYDYEHEHEKRPRHR